MSEFYEVLSDFKEDGSETTLNAAFTPNNGIRLQIYDPESYENWISFDFTEDQAEIVGQALVRWAQRSRAETELIRCNMDKGHR